MKLHKFLLFTLIFTAVLVADETHTNSPSNYQTTKAKEIYHAAHPFCEICGIKKSLESKKRNPVHHRLSVKTHPHLAATQTNLVTLCIGHHFTVGHGNNYQKQNPNLSRDIELLRLIHLQIRRSAE